MRTRAGRAAVHAGSGAGPDVGTDAEGALAVAVLRETMLSARHATRRVAAVLASEGFTVDEWLVLESLAERPGTTMSELREATVTDKATLGRRVDQLVTRALAYREVDGFDRRVIRVHLSSRGRDVLSGLDALLAQQEHPGAPRDE